MNQAVINAIVTSLLSSIFTIGGGLCVALWLEKFKVTKIRENKFLDKYFETIEGIGEHLSHIEEAFRVLLEEEDNRGVLETDKEKKKNLHDCISSFAHYSDSRRVYLTPRIDACLADLHVINWSLLILLQKKKFDEFFKDRLKMQESIFLMYNELYAEILPFKPKHWQNQSLKKALDAIKKENDMIKTKFE